MGLNFYDYDGLQPKMTPPKHFSQQCTSSSKVQDSMQKQKDDLKNIVKNRQLIHTWWQQIRVDPSNNRLQKTTDFKSYIFKK